MRHLILTVLTLMGVAGVFWGVSRLPQTDLFQWTILAESKLIHGSRIQRVGFLDKENGVIVGTSFIARSNDGGKEWNVVHAANEKRLLFICLLRCQEWNRSRLGS